MKVSNKAKTGMVIMAALLAAALVIINLGDIGFREKYSFFILFDDIADLPPQAAVKISGVEVGRVSSIDLYNGRARVRVRMEEDIVIRKDSEAKIMRMGLIGHTYLALSMGTDEYPVLQPGDTIEGVPPLSYESVLESFINGLNEASEVFGLMGKDRELIENISIAFRSLREAGENLTEALGPDGYKLSRTLDNISLAAEHFSHLMEDEAGSLRDAVNRISNATAKIDDILAGISEGRGVAGKLLTSDEYADRLSRIMDEVYFASEDLRYAAGRIGGIKTGWETDIYHDFSDEEFRAGGGLKIMTPSDNFLSFRVENLRPDYSSSYDTGGDRANALTVIGGKQIGRLDVYGGAIRSSGGLGARWHWGRGIDTGADIFDFYSDTPRLNLGGRLQLTQFLRLGLSYEDILSDGSFRSGIAVDFQ